MPKQFVFKVDGEVLFSYILNSTFCLGTSKTGNRCKRKCIIGFEYCPTHLESIKHLKIKTSTIPNAGLGLFCFDRRLPDNSVVFNRNDVITAYNGTKLNRAQLEARYQEYTAPYALKVGQNHYIDPATKRGVGSLINHKELLNQTNSRFSVNFQAHTATVKATKAIRNGQEIFINYGDEYNLDEEGVEYQTKNYYKKN